MKLPIYDQTIEVSLDEIAETCAKGDVIAFGQMLVKFCEHLEEREKAAGYSDLKFFDTVFGIVVGYMSEEQIAKLQAIIDE